MINKLPSVLNTFKDQEALAELKEREYLTYNSQVTRDMAPNE